MRLTPIHPGEILAEDFMAPRGLSANKLALDLHVAPNRFTEIVRGRRAITAETALRLARYFETSPAFWMNLQSQFDLHLAKEERGAAIEREVIVAQHG